MLKFIGFITKDMYYTQNKEIISPELIRYKVPLKTIDSLDINRTVRYNEETGEVVLESLKDKGARMQMLFILEKEDARPIIGIDQEDGPVEDDETIDPSELGEVDE
jgi:hypothetical protein